MCEPKFYHVIQSEPGYNLLLLRTMAGLTIRSLAAATGVHRQTISRIEGCQYTWDKMPMGILMKLFAFFGQRLVISFEPVEDQEVDNEATRIQTV